MKNIIKIFYLSIGYLIASAPCLIILLIRPIMHLRFAKVDVMNFGRFFDQINLFYGTEQLIKKENKKVKLIIFYGEKKTCNDAIKKICSRTIKVYEFNIFLFWIEKFLRFFKFESHLYSEMNSFNYGNFYLKLNNNFNKKWGWTYPNYIKFNNNEINSGYEILEKFKLSKKDKWICIHNRDEKFKKQISKELNIDWYNEQFHSHRNFAIKLLKQASEYFASKGYYVFRMGRNQSERFSTNNKKIIDYAFSENRSPLGDIFLLGNCSAFFGADSGASTPSITLRRPVGYINYTPFNLNNLTFYETLPCLIKKVRSKKTGTFLSIKEIFENDLMGQSYSHKILEKGYELVDNSEEEIRDLAVETCEYLDGKLYYNKEEHNNNLIINKIIFKNFKPNLLGKKKITLGKSFLNKNLYLIK